jgi:hypothetical protein
MRKTVDLYSDHAPCSCGLYENVVDDAGVTIPSKEPNAGFAFNLCYGCYNFCFVLNICREKVVGYLSEN